MIWELFLGMFLILGSAWILVNIVEIYTKVEKWLQKDKWFQAIDIPIQL